jgi:Uma2 family endonuclease
MTPEERERFLLEVLDALSDPRSAMSEGRPHKKAKTRALDMLGLHFKAMGRVVYLAEEMAVVYPREEVFTPDLLAVVGVEEPEDDERMAWVVADEGRGLDVVLEVLHMGNRDKDLVENVQRYARLGIPEYFVYDRGRQQLHGYRLAGDDAKRYQRIVPQRGRYSSTVLGLDLAIQGGRLRFFQGMAELFDTAELLGRLTGMMEEMEAKAEQAEAKAEQARMQAEQAEAKAEQARMQVEQATTQARMQAEQALTGMRETILAVLHARGIPCPEDARSRLMSCNDFPTLQRWVLRATAAGTAAEVFEGEDQAPRE